MLSASSLATEQQFCTPVAVDASAPGWVAREVLHTGAVSGDSSAGKELQEELARN